MQQPRALAAFVIALAAVAAIFAVQALLGEARPGSAMGLVWGGLAAVLMVAAALLGVRRRTMRWGLGRAQDWAQLHVYGGTLALVLALFHAGWRWPRGWLDQWLLGLSVWVVASGLAGVALRKTLPKMLTGLSVEVLYERIPELAAELRERAEELAAAASVPVRELYRQRLRPVMDAPRVRWAFFLDPTGGAASRLGEIDFLRERLEPAERERLERLSEIYQTKLGLDAHFTLQRPLRLWLWLHVPPSLVLLALLAVHVAVALFY